MNNDIDAQTVLVDRANEAFLRGDRKEIAPKEEIFHNINRLLDLPYSIADNERAYELSTALTSGVGFIIFGVIFLGALILDVPGMVVAPEIPKYVPAAILLGGFVMMVFDGYKRLRYAYFLVNPPTEQTEASYRKLAETGEVIAGEATDAFSQVAPTTRIVYQFTNPSGKKIKGTYYTVTNQKLKAKDKVAVLYLTDKIHILL